MVFTYNIENDAGVVRMLIGDTDADNALFQDAEIDALLTLEGGVVRLAAAQALDTIGSSEVMILKVIRLMDLETDGAAVSRELRQRATALRKQHEEGSGDYQGMFDWAEMALDPFGTREILSGVRV